MNQLTVPNLFYLQLSDYKRISQGIFGFSRKHYSLSLGHFNTGIVVMLPLVREVLACKVHYSKDNITCSHSEDQLHFFF